MTAQPPFAEEYLDPWCFRDGPGLDELLADEIMEPVMRSAHIDREQRRQELSDVALRRARDSS